MGHRSAMAAVMTMEVPPVMMVAMPMRTRAHPVALLYPAPAVPDGATDVADVLNQAAFAGCGQSAGARQGQGLRTAGDKQRSSCKRQGSCGDNHQTTHMDFSSRRHHASGGACEVFAASVEIARK